MRLLILAIVLGVSSPLTMKEYEEELELKLLKTLEKKANSRSNDEQETNLYNNNNNEDDDDDEEELADYDEAVIQRDPWGRRKIKPGQSRRQRRWRKIIEHGRRIYYHVRPHIPYFAHGLKLLLGKKKKDELKQENM